MAKAWGGQDGRRSRRVPGTHCGPGFGLLCRPRQGEQLLQLLHVHAAHAAFLLLLSWPHPIQGQDAGVPVAPGALRRGELVFHVLTQEHSEGLSRESGGEFWKGARWGSWGPPGPPSPAGMPRPHPWPRTHLPLWPNRRKRTQKMMQVTPMWMPTTMPAVDVWLAASSFRQSQGGLRTVGRGKLGLRLSWPEAPPDTQPLGTPPSATATPKCVGDSAHPSPSC